MRIYLADYLSVEDCLKAKHTVCGRVLRTDVDYIIVVGEELMLCGYEFAVAVEVVLNGIVRLGVVLKGVLVVLWTHVVVLPERIAIEI